MQKIIIFTLGIFLAIFSSAIIAQPPSLSHIEKVEKLLELSAFDKILDQRINNAVKQCIQDPRLAYAEKDIKEFFSEIIKSKALREEIVLAYTKAFTEEDLEELIEFNQSRVGRKAMEKMPELMNEILSGSAVSIEKNKNKIVAFMDKIVKNGKNTESQ